MQKWCEKALRYKFSDHDLLTTSLTHRSAAGANNERLEFLGDAVLELVVSRALYEQKPNASEGALSRYRAQLVRKETLAEIAFETGLDQHIVLGPGENKSGGRRRASVVANALEAILGAIYLDGGFEQAERVIHALLGARLRNLPTEEELKDAKTRLQEHLQALGHAPPDYEICPSKAPRMRRPFTSAAESSNSTYRFPGAGKSRRKAEQSPPAWRWSGSSMTDSDFRAGFVAVVGRPNTGKSTLVNALMDEKISIVTSKPQTTRHSIMGIRTDAATQVIFVDTPGLHAGSKKLMNRAMNRVANASLAGADLALFVTDATGWTRGDDHALQCLRDARIRPF